MANSKTIVFVHGLHENAHSWSRWRLFFENLGYACYTPDYPYHGGVPNELRKNPNRLLAKVKLSDVVSHYTDYIDNLKDEGYPILIGHSMGGLIVQKLIQSKKGSLGVCITSASPQGLLSFKWSFIKSNWGTVNPLKANSLFCGSKEWFHYAICNTLSRQESDEIYQNAVIPESRNIPRSSRGIEGKINFNIPHSPLLFIGAEKDNIIPLSLNMKNAKRYKDKNSITEFKEFKGRSHGICIQDGWQEVAQFIEDWVLKNAGG